MVGLRLCTIKWSHSVSGNKDLMPSFTCGSQPGASWMRNGPHRVVHLNVSWGQKCLGEALGAKVLREEVLTLGMGFDVSKVHGSLSALGLWIKQHPLLSTPGSICIYHSYCSRAVPAACCHAPCPYYDGCALTLWNRKQAPGIKRFFYKLSWSWDLSTVIEK